MNTFPKKDASFVPFIIPCYEHYNKQGMLQEKRMLQIRFALLQRAEFETLAAAAGFQVLSFYGDYAYTPFQEETSPYMIWVLGK